MADIRIHSLTKRFGKTTAVDHLNLDIEQGEFVTLLGPSGCGKTTTLRCLTGLEEPDEGEIYFGKRCVFSREQGIMIPPGKRGIGLVFQNYALWPHMTVFQNVGFGLEKKNLPKEEIKKRVLDILNLLGLSGYERRYPSELSGGQQQRVALARMIVTQPEILLFDEPLSNLDAKLRMTLRAELKRLHNQSNATTVYVTHDQLEALTLSTRIAVMNLGVLQQIGTPKEVYHFPQNSFVAEFMGSPSTNLLPARVIESGPPAVFSVEGSDRPVTLATADPLPTEKEVMINVRPEDVGFAAGPSDEGIPAIVYASLPTGSEYITYARLDPSGKEIVMKGPEEEHAYLQPDRRFLVTFKRGNVFHAETGAIITSFGFPKERENG